MMKKKRYMTYAERLKLEALREAKIPVQEIARQLGFSRQTIYNELKRGAYVHDCGWYDAVRYSADKAQQIHDQRQTAKGRPLKIGNDHAYANFLERKILHERFSPAAALASARKEGFTTRISVGTLYSYITAGVFLSLTDKDLWEKPKRKRCRKAPERRVAHPRLPSITDRPWYINDRQEVGHWEMDLIVGRAGSRAVLLTLTERVTREEIIRKLPDRKAVTIRRAIDRLERNTPNFREKFRSITTDNGPEFLEYDLLKRSVRREGDRFDIWYCHSYAAWEKGSNENHNRMIRRFFPKGTDFGEIPQRKIRRVQDWMNNYPRRILDWESPSAFAGIAV